jgi:hypothetical protein
LGYLFGDYKTSNGGKMSKKKSLKLGTVQQEDRVPVTLQRLKTGIITVTQTEDGKGAKLEFITDPPVSEDVDPRCPVFQTMGIMASSVRDANVKR